MKYTTYLKNNKECPFCSLNYERVLKGNKSSYLILAQAPYTKGHLLVVSKSHKIKLGDLTKKEKDDIERLVYFGMNILHKKYENVSILYREGNKKGVGKSIDHIHYHLIPNLKIGACDINSNVRKILSDEEYVKLVSKMKKIIN